MPRTPPARTCRLVAMAVSCWLLVNEKGGKGNRNRCGRFPVCAFSVPSIPEARGGKRKEHRALHLITIRLRGRTPTFKQKEEGKRKKGPAHSLKKKKAHGVSTFFLLAMRHLRIRRKKRERKRLQLHRPQCGMFFLLRHHKRKGGEGIRKNMTTTAAQYRGTRLKPRVLARATASLKGEKGKGRRRKGKVWSAARRAPRDAITMKRRNSPILHAYLRRKGGGKKKCLEALEGSAWWIQLSPPPRRKREKKREEKATPGARTARAVGVNGYVVPRAAS